MSNLTPLKTLKKAPEKADPQELVGRACIMLNPAARGLLPDAEYQITGASRRDETIEVINIKTKNTYSISITEIILLSATPEEFEEELSIYEEKMNEIKGKMEFMKTHNLKQFSTKSFKAAQILEQLTEARDDQERQMRIIAENVL